MMRNKLIIKRMNAQLWVALVQYIIVVLCVIVALQTGLVIDWLVALSWAMTATLWLVQGIRRLEL